MARRVSQDFNAKSRRARRGAEIFNHGFTRMNTDKKKTEIGKTESRNETRISRIDADKKTKTETDYVNPGYDEKAEKFVLTTALTCLLSPGEERKGRSAEGENGNIEHRTSNDCLF